MHFRAVMRPGSPPHMRGKAICQTSQFFWYGITPAHAGKSFFDFFSEFLQRDHPRTCGEKMGKGTVWRPHRGSPPHMRGKAPNSPFTPRPLGITPAHAGKRLYQDGALVAQGDHPRTCGEKSAAATILLRPMGSPPHMRGKVALGARTPMQCGITPAHAGKSRQGTHGGMHVRDHPRTCGEKSGAPRRFAMSRGSPPHMRGKVLRHTGVQTLSGITPAHAGKRPS